LPDNSPRRRSLTFASLADAVGEAERLLAGGYDRAGNWDLAQTCGHLAQWARFPVDGFPKAPLPIRGMLWAMRHTVGPRMLWDTLAKGTMPAGGPTLKQTVPPSGAASDAAAVAAFREAVGRFEGHVGAYHPSPLFGALDRPTATKLQRVHCAHHLGMLVPRSG
jgi:hypothetical protein